MSTRRALLFSFLDRYFNLVIVVASSMIIARLLTPEDIGVFSVAMALLALASNLRDLGAGHYVVQTKEITREQLTGVWTIQFLMGASLALVSVLIAEIAARYFSEPRIAGIIYLAALNFLITPIGSLTYALLMRDMQFGKIALMRSLGALTGALVSISLAAWGQGPISLAWGMVAASATSAAVSLFYRPSSQTWRLSLKTAREVLGFGSRVAAGSMIDTLVASLPDFFLGKFQSMAAAGYYSRANGLIMMYHRLVTDAVFNVAVASFSRVKRDQGSVSGAYLDLLERFLRINLCFGVGLFVLANELVLVLYGDGWRDSVVIVQWLSVSGAFSAIHITSVAFLLAMGNARVILKTTIFSALLVSAAIMVGSQTGALEIARLVAFAQLVATMAWIVVVRRLYPYPMRTVWPALLRTLIHPLVLLIAMSALREAALVGHITGLAHLLLVSLASVMILLIVMKTIKDPLLIEIQGWLLNIKTGLQQKLRP